MTVRDYLRSMNLLHLALLAGMVGFCIVSFFVVDQVKLKDEFMEMILPVMAVIGLGSVFGGLFLFRKMNSNIPEDATFAEKLNKYRGTSIIKWALIEGPTLLCIACYIITAQIGFIVAAIGLILFFILHRPAKARIISDLALPPDERDMLNDVNTRI